MRMELGVEANGKFFSLVSRISPNFRKSNRFLAFLSVIQFFFSSERRPVPFHRVSTFSGGITTPHEVHGPLGS